MGLAVATVALDEAGSSDILGVSRNTFILHVAVAVFVAVLIFVIIVQPSLEVMAPSLDV